MTSMSGSVISPEGGAARPDESGLIRRGVASVVAFGIAPVYRAIDGVIGEAEREYAERGLRQIATTSPYTVGINNGFDRRVRRVPDVIHAKRVSEKSTSAPYTFTSEATVLRGIVDRSMHSKIALRSRGNDLKRAWVKEVLTFQPLDEYEASLLDEASGSPQPAGYLEVNYISVAGHDSIDYGFAIPKKLGMDFVDKVSRHPETASQLATVLLNMDRLSEDPTGRATPETYPKGITQEEWKGIWSPVLQEVREAHGDLVIRAGYKQPLDEAERV